jgi:hypothetical protein
MPNERLRALLLERGETLDKLAEAVRVNATVWLYMNDRQIKQVSYREVLADHVSYLVTVRSR